MNRNIFNNFGSIWENGEQIKFFQILLETGFNINSWKNWRGRTMLTNAAEWGDLETVEFLVQKGADGDVRNSDGSKPLHIAAEFAHKDIVEFFITLGVFVDSRDKYRHTPLHYIAKKAVEDWEDRYVEIINFLVSKGANLNAVDRDGATPLLLAAYNSHLAIVELLIKLGADDKCCCKNQNTLLHHAARNGWGEIVQSLIRRRTDFDINAKNKDYATPLILAAESSHKVIVKLLLDSGADVEYQVYRNSTLLHFASENGWLDIVRHLMKNGWDINAKAFLNVTPLEIAIKKRYSDLALHLIGSGAAVDCCGGVDNKQTLLHVACSFEFPEIINLLLEEGCNINAQDSDFHTPLHLAVRSFNFHAMKFLLEAGPDFTKKDRSNRTALNRILDNDCNGHKNFVRRQIRRIKLFFENGAYFQSEDYVTINQKPELKEAVLQNTRICTQSVINCFNNADLPKIYEMHMASVSLPPIVQLKIVPDGNVAQDIEQNVKLEIEMNGYCNVLEVCPIALNVLCVKSFLGYYNNMLKNEKPKNSDVIGEASAMNSPKKLHILKDEE